jgi:hypothetical protein
MGQKGGNAPPQPSAGGAQYKLASNSTANSNGTGNVSSLPPIVSAGQGSNTMNQSKYVDPKTGRTMNQSSNQQKKRKKYKMNYAQQVRRAILTPSLSSACSALILFSC